MNKRIIVVSQLLLWLAFITLFMGSQKMAPMWLFWVTFAAAVFLVGWRLFRRPV